MKKLITLAIISVLATVAHADTFIATIKNGTTIVIDNNKKCSSAGAYGEIISKNLKQKELICWRYNKESKTVGITYRDGTYKEFSEKLFKNTKDQDDENQGD